MSKQQFDRGAPATTGCLEPSGGPAAGNGSLHLRCCSLIWLLNTVTIGLIFSEALGWIGSSGTVNVVVEGFAARLGSKLNNLGTVTESCSFQVKEHHMLLSLDASSGLYKPGPAVVATYGHQMGRERIHNPFWVPSHTCSQRIHKQTIPLSNSLWSFSHTGYMRIHCRNTRPRTSIDLIDRC